ncbi:hypothetical protein IC757_06800 [Wenzhouxiangella sp. AB-CW3]|uniref:hypothetical protein n=1 Tax=Wenzhouxiangella sp. AB-CW3 TaxID=2771012 RepID=UPI00168AF32C|nr:hypothetical protein [Wenzhouxiangella sp. AB-CW3]QOC23827.1 hypothetical protein IC757_06800 [Wenzhouxiangella sp. AB-CW3]
MMSMHQQRGAALFAAIFLITVITVAAAAIALTSATQHTGQARALLAEQAWYAAMARLESEIPSILGSNSCTPGGQESLFGFQTTFFCDADDETEGDTSYRVYTLEAGARQGSIGQTIFVRRTVRAQIADEG